MAHQSISLKTIDLYLSLGRNLTPLKGKKPFLKNWPNKELSKDQLVNYIQRGFNIGFVLGKRDLIIDVDPKNGGLESLKKLRKKYKIPDLSSMYPTVVTGSMGYHYYTRLPKGIEAKQIKTGNSKYPGIDIKKIGGQVVIPGSIHPNGNYYLTDTSSPFQSKAKPILKKILKLYKRKGPLPDNKELKKRFNLGSKIISPKKLKKILDLIPIEEFNENETWLPILIASFNSTGGKGLKAFLRWSLKDPLYSGQKDEITQRWKSFRGKDPDRKITINTLLKEVTKRHDNIKLNLSSKEEVENDFSDLIHFDSDLYQILDTVKDFTPETPNKQLQKVLKQSLSFPDLDKERIYREIHKRTKQPVSALRRYLERLRSKELRSKGKIEDTSQEIIKRVLTKYYNKGAHIMHGEDMRYWAYNDRYWQPKQSNVIEKHLYSEAINLKYKNPSLKKALTPMVTQAERLLRAVVASERNLFREMESDQSIINTLNYELWVDDDSGKIELKDHDPESFLTYCLDTNYNPSAKCPRFSHSLEQIFEGPAHDPKDIVRHLWEIIGYAIQAKKNIPIWVLFHGKGRNGKTVILKIISALLGESALEKPILDLDTARNNHALADLPGKLAVIDEDVHSSITLPDGILKKVSENKTLVANPKNANTFRFKNTAIALLAANNWPITKDLSDGLRRRALVFNFQNVFDDDVADINLADYVIKEELDGVLNKALKGLRRLRKRGHFKIPEPCDKSRKIWFLASSQIYQFITENFREHANKKVTFKKVWDLYKVWCMDNGINRPLAKHALRKGLEDIGCKVQLKGSNRLYLMQYRIDKQSN